MAVRSTQGQNRAVRSTQVGRGVSPSPMLGLCMRIKITSIVLVNRFFTRF